MVRSICVVAVRTTQPASNLRMTPRAAGRVSLPERLHVDVQLPGVGVSVVHQQLGALRNGLVRPAAVDTGCCWGSDRNN